MCIYILYIYIYIYAFLVVVTKRNFPLGINKVILTLILIYIFFLNCDVIAVSIKAAKVSKE